jgi:hypothetical protein
VIKNENAFEVLLEPLAIDYEGVSNSKLVLIIDSAKGEAAIQADYSALMVNPRSPDAVENWVFKVREEDVADVRARGASRAFASIYFELGEEAGIVSKSSLIERLPAEENQPRSWRRVLARILPGSRLVAEGRRVLAVKLPESEPIAK